MTPCIRLGNVKLFIRVFEMILLTIRSLSSIDNVEYLSNQNRDLQKILETEYLNQNLNNIVLAKVLVDKNSPFLS